MIKKFEEFVNEGIIMKTIKRSYSKDTRKEDDITLIIKDFMEKEEHSRWFHDYTINPDKSVDIKGEMHIYEHDLIDGKLPFKFGKITGSFYCSSIGLTSLENAPDKCYIFKCNDNYLKNLIGGPKEVGYSYFCFDNKLTSLEGCPEIIPGTFNCGVNYLTNLIGGPKEVNGNFICVNNELTSLEGCPEKVDGNFDCDRNSKINTLEYFPKVIGGHLFARNNNKKIFTIPDIKKICDINKPIHV